MRVHASCNPAARVQYPALAIEGAPPWQETETSAEISDAAGRMRNAEHPNNLRSWIPRPEGARRTRSPEELVATMELFRKVKGPGLFPPGRSKEIHSFRKGLG